ncbi:MAG: lytic transglycosylase domain-containing protein [Candidatus Acidulodesulfobacterium ferriphilum]|uniref:Lytic transglycosylase domain-containing protein n=1 Tax=Candidatus Acidulodesulfobacterium ferriphilum TaxID=2597223 RepID=A0A519BBJ8_9DELT|nr:MAG: lytic transglycosylase domain-containing protein [Candidatus Acidulodesulfobacterium ferriphilum]
MENFKIRFFLEKKSIFTALLWFTIFLNCISRAYVSFGFGFHRKGYKFSYKLFDKTIMFASNKYKIPALFLIAVIRAESNFNINAVSPEGAVGLMQVMPNTAKTMNLNAFNPLINIIAGAKYLRYCLTMFDYKPVPALACYNAGPGSVKIIYAKNRREFIIPPYRQTEIYIMRVYKYYDYYRKLLKH